MLVPVVVAASASPSPAKVLPVTETVALARVVLPVSETVTFDDSVTAAPSSVKAALVATFESVGGLLTAVMLTVVVVGVLRLRDGTPSLSTQVTVRVASDPKSVGLLLVDLKAIVSST